ncbi:MAG: zinc ribbon domain-containing protein [Acidimicrobiales bacterium]
MTVYDDLLAVQALDTTADQMRHKRSHLPERSELVEQERALAALDRKMAELQSARDAIARTEKRLEDEIASVRAKAEHADRTLYSGTTNSPKELQAIQDEIASLGRRQRHLEDEELEAMEQAEPLDVSLAALDAERAAIDTRCTVLIAAIAEAEDALDGDLEVVLAERSTAAAPVSPELLATYDRLRLAHGGVAVARLNGNRCEGCHLTLSAVEVDQIRHESSEVEVHCSECDRLLVR